MYNFSKYDLLSVDQFQEIFVIIQKALNLFEENISTNQTLSESNESDISTLFLNPEHIYTDYTTSTGSSAASLPVYNNASAVDTVKVRVTADLTRVDKLELICQAKMDVSPSGPAAYIKFAAGSVNDTLSVSNTAYADKSIELDVSGITGIQEITITLNAQVIVDPQEIDMRYVSILGYGKRED